MDIVVVGPKGGETKIALDDGKGLRADFLNKTFVKNSLGARAQEIIAEERASIRKERQKLKEVEKRLKQQEQLSYQREKENKEVEVLRGRIDQTQAKIDAIQDNQGSSLESEAELSRLRQLKKNLQTEWENAKKAVAEIEKQAKTKEKEQQQAKEISAARAKVLQEEEGGRRRRWKKVEELRSRIERTQAGIDTLKEEQGSNAEEELRRLKQLQKNLQTDFENAKKEVATPEKQEKNKEKEQSKVDRLRANIAAKESDRNLLEERLNSTKPLDDLKEQESELQRQNEEDQAIIQDENASPSDIEAAGERVAERNEELARLQTQIAEREGTRPLLERIKEIFKKYGVTETAFLLATGVIIGAVVSAITNASKATSQAFGNGLKDIGAKLGSLLPGLIGSIVNFLFKGAGQAIGFLAEHTWLLILAAAVFLFEKYIKKRR